MKTETVTEEVTRVTAKGNADDLQSIIDRVRRSTRSVDVIIICDELQRRLVGQKLIDAARGRDVVPAKPKLSRAEIQKSYRQRKKEKSK